MRRPLRGGKKHSNCGNTVNEMLVHMARKIRKAHREQVPIIVRMAAGGFFDDEVFKVCEQLHIGYLCGSKRDSNVIDEQPAKVGCEELLDAGKLLGLYHDRGADELANRALKGTSKNLLRGLIAALGGARNPHVQCVHSGFCAPSALHSALS